MYTYYGTTALGYRYSNTVRSMITRLQILQMVLGTAICVHNIVVCNNHPLNLYLCLSMYISYAYLFVKLYREEYNEKKVAAQAKAKAQ